MATARESARRNNPTNKGMSTVCHARSRSHSPPWANEAPRAHWASCTRPNSSAVTGMKRSASENTMAMSSLGTPMRLSGRRNPASAFVRSVDVVV